MLFRSAGAVLDPVVAIRTTVLLRPHETVRVHLVTGIADTRAGAEPSGALSLRETMGLTDADHLEDRPAEADLELLDDLQMPIKALNASL